MFFFDSVVFFLDGVVFFFSNIMFFLGGITFGSVMFFFIGIVLFLGDIMFLFFGVVLLVTSNRLSLFDDSQRFFGAPDIQGSDSLFNNVGLLMFG